jgi:hypothetical protein
VQKAQPQKQRQAAVLRQASAASNNTQLTWQARTWLKVMILPLIMDPQLLQT